MPRHDDLRAIIRRALEEASDPDRAIGQQRCMRSAMPYRGLTSPVLRARLRPILDDPQHRFRSRAEWESAVRVLWDEATHREEWYAALARAKHRHYRHGWTTS